jgi:AAA+ superfamily predicted ATPase
VAKDAFLRDLELLIRARHALIFLDTDDKDRAESLLQHLAEKLRLPSFSWTRTKGLRDTVRRAPDPETMSAAAALQKIEQMTRPGIYNFRGLGSDLEDRVLATQLRDAATPFMRQDGAIIVSGDEFVTPSVLRSLVTTVTLPAPSDREYRELVQRIYRDLSERMHVELRLTKKELEQLVANLRGLTMLEAEKILTKAMVEDGQLGPGDIRRVIDAKKQVLEREGVLEYYPVEETLADIAGLGGLKRWLAKRRAIIAEPRRAAEFGLSFPKGILLVGVQGAGKSLCAKAVAMDWGLPLLKMDPAGLYNKYIGESEKNFARATAVAEKMAPVVLWIDEIEKAFASGGDTDGGVSVRVLGTFLSWLQERKGDVFVIATANNIDKLPPELVRKGRFDEIFFVDLPSAEVRREIFAIHLKKRNRTPQDVDLDALAAASDGFSGAEIEQVVVSALYTAFADGAALSTELLSAELAQTKPLSVTMRESIDALRTWAQERTVSAN